MRPIRRVRQQCLLVSIALLSGVADAFVSPQVAGSRQAWRRSSRATPMQLLLVSRTSDTSERTDTYGTNEDDNQVLGNNESIQQQQQQIMNADGSLALSDISIERTERINQAALYNGAVVGLVAFSAVYQLLHEDVEALLALWEYGLGPHGPDVTMAAVALDLLTRLPLDALHSYEALVPTNPVFYKACTSGVAYALGDFLSQVYQGRTIETIDLPRTARSGAAGFIAHGPLCHYWLLGMETYLDFDGAWWATGIKVTADLTVWSIFLNAAYSSIIGLLAFRPPFEVFEDVKATTWPALRSAWRFWPFVHTVSFSHAVPIDLKLLWVDVMEVVWVTILSKVANEDKNAKLEQNPEAEVLSVVEPFGVEPGLEIELTREKELDPETSGQLAFVLPRKVLGACWPLIAMWPVLYAGYQIERTLGLVH